MKKILFGLAVMACLMARADYLYWMVDTDSANEYNYDTVRLVDASTGNAVDAYTGITPTAVASYMTDPGYFTAGGSDVTYTSTQSFYIELLNGSESLAKTAAVDYSTLLSNGSIFKTNGMTPGTITPYGNFGAYNVPEPTSGLLFVIGGMLLGLKRKRQV